VPGATDAGVVHYIDRQLATRLARHQRSYRNGLEAFARTCVALHGQSFAELSPHQKIAFMQKIESGKVPTGTWGEPSAPAFFRLLVDHTMQGFYGSPRHGGNRDYISYRILGLDYPQVIGRNRQRS
jgi:gluconate 2-dehydrogenase gamma chain